MEITTRDETIRVKTIRIKLTDGALVALLIKSGVLPDPALSPGSLTNVEVTVDGIEIDHDHPVMVIATGTTKTIEG